MPDFCLLDSQAQLQDAFSVVRPIERQFWLSKPYQVLSEAPDQEETAAKPRKRRKTAASEHKALHESTAASDTYVDGRVADERELQRHAGFLPVISAALTQLTVRQYLAGAVLPGMQAQRQQALGEDCSAVQASSDQAAPGTHTQAHSELDFVALLGVAPTVKPKFEYQQASWLPPSSSKLPIKSNLFNKLIRNTAQVEQLGLAHDMPVIIPADCTFMLGDISTIKELVAGSASPFHCIVIDPPWENASARRSGQYATLPSRYLLSMPMKQLLEQREGLVVLWMTNRSRLWRFMETELLPAWGLRICATWLWLKVTSSDHQPVTPLQASHRRPYEVMLLLVPQDRQVPPDLQPPDNFVVAATPGEHSRKPHLSSLLTPYLPLQARCAELFARQLWPGWTSWGNDVLHFQHLKYFQVPPEDQLLSS